jgi:hypothetical protein
VRDWDQSLSFSPGIQNTNRKSAEAAIMYLRRGRPQRVGDRERVV